MKLLKYLGYDRGRLQDSQCAWFRHEVLGDVDIIEEAHGD
jgi:hypothetical protein